MEISDESDLTEVSDEEMDSIGDSTNDEHLERLTARPYQVELLHEALKRNIIVCLGTGTGKTFISVMLIKELAHQIRRSFENGGRRTFFLVNTVPLVFQQAKVIQDETDLKVGTYVGDIGVDFWDQAEWQKEFKKNHVLVMTAQIFLDILHHGFLGLSKANLLVFDECHHAKKEHPFKRIMTFFDVCPKENYPRVLGLTASVVNGKVSPWKIESEIKQLEATLRASCQTASDAEEIVKYGAKPFEDIVTYSKNSAILEEDDELLSETLKSSLTQALEFLNDCRIPDVRLKNAHQSVKSAVRECLDTLKDIGPWSAYQVAGYLVRDLERAELFQVHDEATTLLQLCATKLRQFRKVYENFTELLDEDYAIRLFMRPKVRTLLNILKQYNSEEGRSAGACETPSNLCGIVFVERRYTSLSLSQLINRVASGDAELKFISCSHVIGHGSAGSIGNDAEMGFRKQEKVLSRFRNHEFNLLIATSVVEEGLDVPKCNCVVRFDFPLNYRSYVQSKGRARAKESLFVILAEEEEKDQIECQLELYKAIEKYLSEACHDRPSPTEEDSIEAVDTDYLPPFMPVKGEGKARLTMSNSISLLCRYCSKLPGDMFTHLMPEFVLEEAGEKAYLCTVHMPTNCPLRRKIVGDPMPQKRLAKMAAAYYACKELFEMKELDDNLLPVRSLSDEESEEEDEEVDDKKAKIGTKKRRRRYERKIPDALMGTLPSPGRQMYLYAIHITPAGESAAPQTVFGLVTKRELTTVCPFELFPDAGPVYVTIEEQTLMRSDARDAKESLENIGRFHCYLFSVVLRKPLTSVPDCYNGYYVVLLNEQKGRYKIDLAQMERFVASSDKPKLFRRRAASNPTEGQVVVPLHSSAGKRTDSLGGGAYRVVKVCHDMSPLSRFPDQSKAKTFEEYYRNEYQKTVTNMEQPLVQVQHMSSRVSFLTNRHKLTKKEKKAQQREIHFIPELCDFLQIPAAILSEALMLPSVLYRFNSLLLVEQLKNTITREIRDTDDQSVTVKGRNVRRSSRNKTKACPNGLRASSSASDKHDNDNFSRKLKELFSNAEPLNIDPDLSLLHQALTTANAADAFDLERLEMLGDAFLKQAVSIFLFAKYEDKDEGRLTKRKIGQISNKALFKMAEPKKLPSYMFSSQLDRGVWCPPDLQVYESSTEELGDRARERKEAGNSGLATAGRSQNQVAEARQRCTTQEISDKSVADSVEALIGAYLTSCGYLGALKFMRYLGIKVLPEETDNQAFEGGPPRAGQYAAVPIPELKHHEEGNIWDTVGRLTSGFDTFEKRINYRFRGDKLYLLQALSHPSYQANRVTGCYQRLEFLGDALLDFLVTQHLYFRHGGLSPGQLTDIRQALVNNNIFATIAVRHGYHKYLKQMSPLWYKTIDNFVVAIGERVEEEQEKGLTVTADSFVILTDSNDEGIEAPKVLGDIFESVAGAVFLDSGMDLIETWKVYYRMMKPYIDHYSENVPLNPIREVYERDEHAEFSKSEQLMDGKIQCTLKVAWGEFVAKGSNGRMAKLAASKIALQRFHTDS